MCVWVNASGADVKRYVSTVIIIVNHVQTLTIIGEMRLEWPLLAKQIMAALSLQALRVPGANPECILDESVPTFWIFAYGESGLILLLQVVLLVLSFRWRTAKTALSIVLSLVLTTSMRTITALFMQASTHPVFGPIGIAIASVLLGVEICAIIYFYRRVRTHIRIQTPRVSAEFLP